MNRLTFDIDGELRKGIQYHQSGQLQKAEKIYKRILKVNPHHSDCLDLLGHIAQKLGKTDIAIDLISQAIQHSPNNPIYYNNLGTAYKHQGKLDEAISYYRKALQLKPDLHGVHYNMASAFQDQGKLDEAISCYQKALQLKPDYAEGYDNMGLALLEQGKTDEAISCYRKAVRLRPDWAETYGNMGFALEKKGKLDEAIAAFRRAADLDPLNPSFKYQIAALTGQTTETAPTQYVKELFDQHANRFEHDLVEKLDYRTPTLLRRSLNSVLKGDVRFQNVIDLGCGTGLSGVEFSTISDRLIGIDVSPKMLEEAKKKQIYDVLHAGDMIQFLNGTDERFDLFIAADVLVYIGDLKPVFTAIQNCSSSGAYFAFSTESSRGENYILRKTRRYAHSVSYIESLAKEYDFVAEICSSEGIRKEQGQWILGNLFILKYLK
ncbi:MAG: tetratricopeptide repeat protein [Planctomycetota bacterium]